MQGVTEWERDALNDEAHGLRLGHGLACVLVMLSADIDEAHDGLSVMLWLAFPLKSSAIPPASGVMQGVTEWGHDALKYEAHGLKYEAHGLRLGHGLACLSVMLSADIDEAHDGLSVMLWLASPLTSSAIPPASGVMQGVTEWESGHVDR